MLYRIMVAVLATEVQKRRGSPTPAPAPAPTLAYGTCMQAYREIHVTHGCRGFTMLKFDRGKHRKLHFNLAYSFLFGHQQAFAPPPLSKPTRKMR